LQEVAKFLAMAFGMPALQTKALDAETLKKEHFDERD